ncbi:hypothetical protein LTR08_001077 [Meristemomyces frigidus]|nr:hypothetical protein LTR08_001077 [Meristemomyces frigidus]
MSASWSGSIVLGESGAVDNVSISTPVGKEQLPIASGSSLRFLSVVEVSRIPLHLVIASRCNVNTTSSDTERWFRYLLLTCQEGNDGVEKSPWWQNARLDSPLGVLLSVDHHGSADQQHTPRVTELLLYASRSASLPQRPPTPPHSSSEHDAPQSADHEGSEAIRLYALALSSDLACQSIEPTPSSSPSAEDTEIEAVFLPSCNPADVVIINEPPVRKRKSVTDTFDEATERRTKARRKGGQGIAAAAAPKTEEVLPSLKHSRTASGPVPLQTRPLSRSPSVSSSRPTTARTPSEAPKRSSLARMQSVFGPAEEDVIEMKNKDLVSKFVMAGLRLYGFSQTKGRKPQLNSGTHTPTVAVASEQREDDRVKDEEYKLTYHQVYKGTCFAFRGHLATTILQPHTEALRETVDALLGVFCNDPLKVGLPGLADELTPGGRKAFGPASHVDSKQSPFAAASTLGASLVGKG